MPGPGRIQHAGLAAKVVPAEQAAAVIRPGDTVGMSGFTGAGHPKAVPAALARQITDAHAAGRPFRVDVRTGASTAPELDGALAAADGIELRLAHGRHTPHLLTEALSWHTRYLETGSMLPG